MLNKTIKFSVVIPVFKRKKLAVLAIHSVLNQKNIPKKQVEIIIVDDDRNHLTSKRNKNFYKSLSENLIYIKNKYSKGPAGARQTGLNVAVGKFITFLDSDDQLKPDFLLTMSENLNSDSNLAGGVCFSVSKFDRNFSHEETVKLLPLIAVRDLTLFFSNLFNRGNLVPASFYLCQLSHMLFRRSIIKKNKFNSEYNTGGEDWDFVVKALERGKISIVLKKLTIFRYSPSSLINKPINRKMKWHSYALLADRLPEKFRSHMFYHLFLNYISLYGR